MERYSKSDMVYNYDMLNSFSGAIEFLEQNTLPELGYQVNLHNYNIPDETCSINYSDKVIDVNVFKANATCYLLILLLGTVVMLNGDYTQDQIKEMSEVEKITLASNYGWTHFQRVCKNTFKVVSEQEFYNITQKYFTYINYTRTEDNYKIIIQENFI